MPIILAPQRCEKFRDDELMMVVVLLMSPADDLEFVCGVGLCETMAWKTKDSHKVHLTMRLTQVVPQLALQREHCGDPVV